MIPPENVSRPPLQIANSFAYYLPQFHSIPQNDIWWGKGFTEWTQLRKAKPLGPGHTIQKPGELGYYQLCAPEVIGRQYALARHYGINTFAFWHYWFGRDDLLLEKPAELLLASTEDVSFCFAWANHDWKRRATGETLKAQRYEDADRHFEYLEPFFHDPRYRRIAGKPVFMLFSPRHHPDLSSLVGTFQQRALASGLPGICFVFDHCKTGSAAAAFCDFHLDSASALKFEGKLRRYLRKARLRFGSGRGGPTFMHYPDCAERLNRHITPDSNELPLVFPGWDTTIRHGANGVCLLQNTPEAFARGLSHARDLLSARSHDKRHIVIKSWNEWAEGNIIEPTQMHGRRYLEVFAEHFVLAQND